MKEREIRSRRMPVENAEERLRSEMYTALVELTTAAAHEKPAIVEHLTQICKELHQVVTQSSPSEK